MSTSPYLWVEDAQLRGAYGEIRSLIAFARSALRNDGEDEVDDEVREVMAYSPEEKT